ncbi:MAG TPA: DUF1289 domain-containing protein [Burkholderiales bacterium]|nr:DUF1289 domain-containing protein [Burkholderiales bacterium]
MSTVPSPCIRNCCLDADDICLGCYRSLREICAWSEAGDDEKMEILSRCRLRCEERQSRRPSDPDVTK